MLDVLLLLQCFGGGGGGNHWIPLEMFVVPTCAERKHTPIPLVTVFNVLFCVQDNMPEKKNLWYPCKLSVWVRTLGTLKGMPSPSVEALHKLNYRRTSEARVQVEATPCVFIHHTFKWLNTPIKLRSIKQREWQIWRGSLSEQCIRNSRGMPNRLQGEKYA